MFIILCVTKNIFPYSYINNKLKKHKRAHYFCKDFFYHISRGRPTEEFFQKNNSWVFQNTRGDLNHKKQIIIISFSIKGFQGITKINTSSKFE